MKNNYDYTNLIDLIDKKYVKRKRFAQAVNMSEMQVSKLLNNKTSFSRETIVLFAKALGIKPNNFYDFFFIRKGT